MKMNEQLWAETVRAMQCNTIVAPPPNVSVHGRLEQKLYAELCAKRMARYGNLRGNEADIASARAQEIRAYYKREEERKQRLLKEQDLRELQFLGRQTRRWESSAAFDSAPVRRIKTVSVDPISMWCKNRTSESVKMAKDALGKPFMSKDDKKLVREAAKYDKSLSYDARKRGL